MPDTQQIELVLSDQISLFLLKTTFFLVFHGVCLCLTLLFLNLATPPPSSY